MREGVSLHEHFVRGTFSATNVREYVKHNRVRRSGLSSVRRSLFENFQANDLFKRLIFKLKESLKN